MEDAERNLVSLYPLPDRRHLSIYFHQREIYLALRDTDY